MTQQNSNDGSLKIGLKAFLVSAAIILALMIVSGILTRVLPAGEYDRVVQQGRTLVVSGSYHTVPKPAYPVWRWFTAPFEIFAAEGNIVLITIIIFIICVSGSITILEKAGVMEDLISRLVERFERNRYALIAILVFFFMAVSSFLGIYEGMVPMIVFIVPLALSLGWDSLTGLGMSLLPLAFGFASAVTNPFTIAIAQKIAGVPLFSGSWLRIIFFAVVYGIVTWYVIRHAKKVAENPKLSPTFEKDEELRRSLGIAGGRNGAAITAAAGTDRRGLKRALLWFGSCMGIAIVVVFLSGQIPALSDLSFPVMGILFLVGGIGGGLLAGLKPGRMAVIFGRGSLNILPGILLIMMAYSVKHIIVSGHIMDTILYGATTAISKATTYGSALLVYAVTLVMNFFIGSASAKAFLMMPILTPLADLVGITRQTAVLAFDFGDGFSNMIFPTNALLLIALSFTVVSYPRWMGWTVRLQAIILLVTAAFLAFAVAIKFGPF